MRHLGYHDSTMKLSLLLLVLAGAALASPITFGTGIGSEGNTLTGTNVATIPAPAWHAPLGTSIWESIQTNSLTPPIPNGTIVHFFFNFNLVGTPTSGALGLLVDDSALVILNGFTIANNLGSPQGGNCAASLPNCVVPLNLNILPQLVSGANVLDVFVRQDGGAQYGLDVYGAADALESRGIPEPGTSALIGLGLLALVLRRR